jgi:cytochrome c oxidase assembly factor CtaG
VFAALLPSHAGPDLPAQPLSGSRWLTAWSPAWVPIVSLGFSAVLYLWAVRRMRAAGNPWPIGRTFAFVGGGLGSALIATCSPLATYDEVLISVHMVQHMILAMITPIFLALGAPVTLALRNLPPGGRRAVLAVMHSRVVAVLTFPVVAGALFIVNPFALYFSGWYELTLRHVWLHELLHLHFVLVGLLWYVPLIGVDPLPRRASYPMRVISAFVTLPFHAWLGVAIMSMNTLIAGDWYPAQHRAWGSSPLSDQHTAGGILWSAGDLVGLIVFAALFRQWVRASEREAKREDRRLDRLDAAQVARDARDVRLAAASSALPAEQQSPP